MHVALPSNCMSTCVMHTALPTRLGHKDVNSRAWTSDCFGIRTDQGAHMQNDRRHGAIMYDPDVPNLQKVLE